MEFKEEYIFPDKVSIDMVDFIVDISNYDFEQYIRPIIDTFYTYPNLNFYEDKRFKRYKYNWTWEVDGDNNSKYSFYFAYSLTINNSTINRFRLSYNPNKVPRNDLVLSQLICVLFGRFDWKLRINSFDVAFDYDGYTTSELNFDKGRKREYKIMKYPNSDITYYIGSRSCDGFVKLYDKASEECSEKNIEKDYNKVRYEITIKPGDSTLKYVFDYINAYGVLSEGYRCKCSFPIFFVPGAFGDFKPNDQVLIYALENGYPVEKLTRRQRERYDSIMKKSVVQKIIKPTPGLVESALRDFVRSFY